jgi:MFS family permease
LQLSLFLVNIWQIPCALAPNFGTIIVGRFLGGLSSAGGSVTLGMVADMWEADDQQYAVAFIVLSSVGGSVVGPIVGAFIQAYLPWYWNFWVQLIFGGAVQAVHFFLVPETRATIMLDKEAKRRRKAGETNIYGPNELKEHRLSMREVLLIWARPFEMFVREPIVLLPFSAQWLQRCPHLHFPGILYTRFQTVELQYCADWPCVHTVSISFSCFDASHTKACSLSLRARQDRGWILPRLLLSSHSSTGTGKFDARTQMHFSQKLDCIGFIQ